jgi:hypothetical protein
MEHARVTPAQEPDTPTGISIGLGAVIVVAAALVAALVPASEGGMRLGLMTVALAGFAAVAVDLRAAAFVLMLGALVFDGFLVNQLGRLTWHGADDLRRLELLAAATLVGHSVGMAYRRLVEWRRFAVVEAWANGVPRADSPDEAGSLSDFDEKE